MFRVLLSPRMIGLHLLALVATSAAVWLGLWQYDAWQTRREIAASDLVAAPPRPLDQVMSSDDPFPGDAIGRPVEFRGRWVPGSTFLVADREHDGDTGYWVITPVAVCDSSCAPDRPAMLVVRGWTDRLASVPAAPTGVVDLTGWLQPPEGSGRADPDPEDDVLQEVRMADALQQVDQDLYGAYVISNAATRDLTQVTPASLPPAETFTAARNLLYALEWWVFGVFALFVWWRWCADEVKDARLSVPGPTGGVLSEDGRSTRSATDQGPADSAVASRT